MIKICVLVLLFNYIQSVHVPSDPVPASVDWRKKGVILPVPERDDSLNSSVVNLLDAISAHYKINYAGSLIELSRQQIYDCSPDWCPGVKSGNSGQILKLISSKGIDSKLLSEDNYPYTGKCSHICPNNDRYSIKQWGYAYNDMSMNAEAYLDRFVSNAPVVVDFNANTDKFKTYSGGIFDDKDCDSKLNHLNHTLLVVGYGSENGINYWIARNNWGTNWGEKGFIRVIRGKNMCGIGQGLAAP